MTVAEILRSGLKKSPFRKMRDWWESCAGDHISTPKQPPRPPVITVSSFGPYLLYGGSSSGASRSDLAVSNLHLANRNGTACAMQIWWRFLRLSMAAFLRALLRHFGTSFNTLLLRRTRAAGELEGFPPGP